MFNEIQQKCNVILSAIIHKYILHSYRVTIKNEFRYWELGSTISVVDVYNIKSFCIWNEYKYYMFIINTVYNCINLNYISIYNSTYQLQIT